jgi:hypothetical protein
MTCAACHQAKDVHGGTEGSACENCHVTSAWKPSTFNHINAAFQLTGAHVSVVCTQCHTTPGKFKGTPSACISCHKAQDPHAGTLGTNCGSCHSTTAWKPASFDHNLAAFKLTGAHTSVQCALCHINGQLKGTPMTCVACHKNRDVHTGTEGTACETCHTTTAWKPSTFDHANASFKLTGAHITTACSLCHKSSVFKGTPSTCVSCHSEPAYHAGLFGTNCATCHTTTNWNAVYTGPHTFPMNHGTKNRTNSPCATCHTVTLSQYTCYNCHNQTEIVSQHKQKGMTNITNCVNCHPTGKNN